MERVMRDVGVVVAAAGGSRRFGRNKLFELLDGMPLFCHSLRRFAAAVPDGATVLVVAAGSEHRFRRAMESYVETSASIRIVPGGSTRQESVLNGLDALPESAEIVAVQDAARPYSSLSLLKACIESARKRGAGVAARRVIDTIKIASPDGRVTSTPARRTLWAAETPQVFPRQALLTAYRFVEKQNLSVTDDSQAVECGGGDVFLVEHEDPNPKITFPHDLSAGT